MGKVRFQLSLRIKNCDRVFAKGFAPGVLVVQEAAFAVPDKLDTHHKIRLARALIDQEEDFIERHVKVDIVELGRAKTVWHTHTNGRSHAFFHADARRSVCGSVKLDVSPVESPLTYPCSSCLRLAGDPRKEKP